MIASAAAVVKMRSSADRRHAHGVAAAVAVENRPAAAVAVENRSRSAATLAMLGAVVAALFVALSVVVAPPARADGDPAGDVIRGLDVVYELDAAGTLHVTETFQWDFGSRNGLGFYRTLLQRMGYQPDDTKVRILEYSNFQVSSPSDAPADVWVEDAYGNEIRLAIGAPDGSSDTRTGVQTYVLSYDVEGTINAIRGQEGVNDQDELFLNVFADSPNRVDSVTVTVRGPADVVDVACYQGGFGDSTPCDSYGSEGPTASFGADGVPSGEGLTIMAAFPSGTFANPGPILVDRPSGSPSTGFPGDPAYAPTAADRAGAWLKDYWPAAAGVWAALLAGIAALRVRGGRDRTYVGLPPGLMPVDGEPAEEVRMTSEPPVAVRFHPPDDLRPAEAEVIEEEHVTSEAFTATMIDLAVRGYLTVAPAATTKRGKVKDWKLALTRSGPPPGELLPFEDQLMRSLFGTRTSVRISKLKGEFASELGKFNKKLTAHSDAEGWFVRRGLRSRGGKISGSVGIFVAAALLFRSDGFSSITMGGGLLLPLIVAGIVALVTLLIVWAATARAARARTAKGRAHYEQIRGFREYLSTAEADQLRWEVGEDIFSKYLPWAIVFGVADRWTSLFEQLAAEGVYTTVPIWYVGYGHPGAFSHHIRSIGNSVHGLETAGMSALTYTPGSSGGSGSFGGGGGFSGGGTGGGSFGGR
ncbi:MAG TPA: DUF2207 domain-containing protein [Actinomycetaceae bacterium]|nr:DUF2207 domain-containing protein [Actinomycetaceae bacterium]